MALPGMFHTEGPIMTEMTIDSIKRLKNSVNGNPRFDITFTNGVVSRTSSDTSFAYAVGNPDMREGSTVRVEYTRAGKISHMEPVKA